LQQDIALINHFLFLSQVLLGFLPNFN